MRVILKFNTSMFRSKYIVRVLLTIFSVNDYINSESYGGSSYTEYGIDWMYFPDGDGVPRFANLSESSALVPLLRMKENEKEIEFRLYTKENGGDYIVLNDINGPYGPYEEFNLYERLSRAPLKVVTHGWMSSADQSDVMNVVNAYLQTQDVNIVAVDWSSYSKNVMYTTVAQETKVVGKRVGLFLNYLQDRYNIPGDNVHLIGHSLGAHVMGIAGFESKYKINRITGLDPALPMFKYIQDDKSRLDYGDADFVDVIHTCGGVLGFLDAIGKADFYPNNGMAPQPGCQSFNIFQIEACSHGRSHIYFAESIINPKAFPTYQCKSWTTNIEKNCLLVGYMGESANPNMSGILNLKTNSEEPFGLI